jgi:AcrR family transcriptional regulator
VGRRKIIEDDQLLAQAREIFMNEGIGVGSRRIAQEIGISSSVLFQRFGSKEGLFFAAMTPPAPDMAALLECNSPNDCARARIEHIAAGLLAYFRQLVPVLTSLATHPSFQYATFAERHPHSSVEKLVTGLIAAMEKQHRNGEIDCPDARAAVLNLVAVAYSLAMFEQLGVHSGQFDHDVVRSVARVLWHGIAPSAEPNE